MLFLLNCETSINNVKLFNKRGHLYGRENIRD